MSVASGALVQIAVVWVGLRGCVVFLSAGTGDAGLWQAGWAAGLG
jgi:hypothetical protein